MAEICVELPDELEEDAERIEREVEEFVSLEEKRKLISLFIDEVMKGAKQLKEDELVKLGRKIKSGRFERLIQVVSKSKLAEKQAEELANEISESLAKRYEKLLSKG